MTTTPVNWGVIGPGKIAEKFARDIRLVPKAALVSVASSDPKRAISFAERCKVPKAAESYFQILNDPEIDAVYIATIHPTHYNIAKDALIAGKHVLIEKPMTVNAAQAKALVSLSRTRGLFLMEAMWTAFLPVYPISYAHMILGSDFSGVSSVMNITMEWTKGLRFV